MENKVSAKELFGSLSDQNIVTATLGNIEIQVKRVLSLQESLAFIEGVVDSCIDYENGNYLPESYDFAVKTAILEFYTNIDVPEDIVSQYELVYSTSVVDAVYGKINSFQFTDNLRAIDKKIDFYVQLICSTVSSKVDDVVQKIDAFASSTSKIFDGINPEQMSAVINNLSVLKANEEAVVQAILNSQNSGEQASEQT